MSCWNLSLLVYLENCQIMSNSWENFKPLLPPKPEEPLDSDCCGTGCSPCVFDIYQEQLLEWENACRTILETKDEAVDQSLDSKSLLSPLHFVPFQLVSVKPHTGDTNIYRFQAVRFDRSDEKPTKILKQLDFKLGQHFLMKSKGDYENSLTRAYTPISDSAIDMPGCFDVLIKLYTNGKMSSFIKNLRKGELVYWRGPFGNFKYICNKYKFLFIFCAGTGIAPMYPIAKAIVKNDMDETVVRFIFSCKNHSNILLRDEIKELAGYWNFTCCTFLSQDAANGNSYRESFVSGRIGKDEVCNELSGKPLHDTQVLICGTKSFTKDVLNYVQQAGVPRVNVYVF